MNDLQKKLTEEEELKLIEETERFMEEVNSDPEVANLTAPPELKEKIFAEIRAREAAKEERLEAEREEEKRRAEEEELIRLGKIYKKKRKANKYLVLAAAVVCALAFGITSFGGPEQIFKRVKSAFVGQEQVNIDSEHEDVAPPTATDEGKAYQEIEDAFGFYPIRLNYLPENIELLDAQIGEGIQGATLIYGEKDEAKIIYVIRPNYRTSSWGEDVEDEMVEEYTVDNEYTTLYLRKYLVEKKEERWVIRFEYNEVGYSLQVCDESKEEVTKIVENLYFP